MDIASIEDGVYLPGHRCALVELGDVALGVVLQV